MTVLGDLIVGFAWRFAWALRPILGDHVEYHLLCHTEHGFLGTHLPEHGRCTTCHRRT